MNIDIYNQIEVDEIYRSEQNTKRKHLLHVRVHCTERCSLAVAHSQDFQPIVQIVREPIYFVFPCIL